MAKHLLSPRMPAFNAPKAIPPGPQNSSPSLKTDLPLGTVNDGTFGFIMVSSQSWLPEQSLQ
jgi:hypothetical protein